MESVKKIRATQIAKYMVETGLKKSLDYNYCFHVDEIAPLFNLLSEGITAIQEEILTELGKYEEVAEASYESDDEFHITFYTGYPKPNFVEIDEFDYRKTPEEYPYEYYIYNFITYNEFGVEEESKLIITSDKLEGILFEPYGKIACDRDITEYFENKDFAYGYELDYINYKDFEEMAIRHEL